MKASSKDSLGLNVPAQYKNSWRTASTLVVSFVLHKLSMECEWNLWARVCGLIQLAPSSTESWLTTLTLYCKAQSTRHSDLWLMHCSRSLFVWVLRWLGSRFLRWPECTMSLESIVLSVVKRRQMRNPFLRNPFSKPQTMKVTKEPDSARWNLFSDLEWKFNANIHESRSWGELSEALQFDMTAQGHDGGFHRETCRVMWFRIAFVNIIDRPAVSGAKWSLSLDDRFHFFANFSRDSAESEHYRCVASRWAPVDG